MATDPKLSSSSIVASSSTGSHVLKIDGYSRTKAIPTGTRLRSASFRASGHDWYLAYYPNGISPETADWVSFFLVLDDHPPAPVSACFTIGLLSQAGKPLSSRTMESEICLLEAMGSSVGVPKFIEREALERSRRCLKDDCFSVRCDITVISSVRTLREAATIPFPRSDCLKHFRGLLLSGQGADVHFRVEGKEFPAHRCVLAARSPVFKAELEGTTTVEVDGIRSDVFMNLLHFVYADSLPTEQIESKADPKEEALMAQGLLVAAERYGMKRLKIVCEDNLCRLIDVDNVATTLAFAEKHSCSGLKKACFHFLKTQGNALSAMMETQGFAHLNSEHPSLIKEMLAEFTAR